MGCTGVILIQIESSKGIVIRYLVRAITAAYQSLKWLKWAFPHSNQHPMPYPQKWLRTSCDRGRSGDGCRKLPGRAHWCLSNQASCLPLPLFACERTETPDWCCKVCSNYVHSSVHYALRVDHIDHFRYILLRTNQWFRTFGVHVMP